MDFIDPQFDNETAYTGTTEEVLVLSTPRSGSTAVCSLLYNNGVGTPHEYFQPHQYLPALARRCGLTDVNDTTLHQITDFLKERRSRNGWFSYNIHSSHIGVLKAFSKSLAAAGMWTGHTLIYCKRLDILDQTVSYYIARKLGQWGNLSTQTDASQALAAFDKDMCLQLYHSLVKQNQLADQLFVQERERFDNSVLVLFEDDWDQKVQAIGAHLPIHTSTVSTSVSQPELKAQVTEQVHGSEEFKFLVEHR